MISTIDQLHLRRLAGEVEAARWQRISANPLHASEVRGTWQPMFYTRLEYRSIASRVSDAYFASERRTAVVGSVRANLAAQPAVPQWTIADIGQRSVADAYGQRASILPPAAYWQPFAASMLAACQHIRRWRWLAD